MSLFSPKPQKLAVIPVYFRYFAISVL